ncbi:hypothetical protein A9Q84_11720 [Halobacteriovorax marinus]|uniref:Uncharacterized protein n=1 Tax=Halobacteriovorax marinus TaxID=97084 RepID=A0A1Y5F7T3_9BACT|nr:hypothetical protein A9Q84_11720 [Halobacteriovorax marinus]
MKIPERIYLKESGHQNVSDWFHWGIENFALFRFMFFKNRPRNSFLLVRATLTTAAIFSIYYSIFSSFNLILFGIDVEPFLIFTTFSIVGYWNMYSNFTSKCQYASSLYNEVIKEYTTGNSLSADLMAINFTNQLIAMDLWGHRMYGPMFLSSLEKAIDYHYTTEQRDETKEELFKRIENKMFRVNEARNLCFNYQAYLYNKCLLENGTKNNHLKAI